MCHWGSWLIFLLGYIFWGGELPREHSDQLNAKDEKTIHDYSQQRCILNQTLSGKPDLGALLVSVTFTGVLLVRVPFFGGEVPRI